MIVLIDNYDSFSYNLYQLLGTILDDRDTIRVVRNDEIDVLGLAALHPSHLVLSPGPGRPEDAGVCVAAVRALGEKTPILGVCLGHQAICVAYGGRVGHARRLRHGVADDARVDTSTPLFAGLPPVIRAGRYHSLAADEASLPPSLAVTARADDEEIMAVQHREFPVFGIQFHPESILTPFGDAILRNFVIRTGDVHSATPSRTPGDGDLR